MNSPSYIIVNLVSSKGKEKQKSMKTLYNLYGKKLLPLPILLLLILSLLSTLNVNTIKVFAAESPCIKVIPDITVDPTLTLGKNYTVSIYTDYAGSNVTSYQFTLSYNPSILEGYEVANGDLIVGGSARFIAGLFNNVAGKLSLTVGFYFNEGEVTSGPGTLATVTFRVIGLGTSDITIGPETKLIGWDSWEWKEYYIIDAATQPTHIQHGSFDNDVHDVSITSVATSSEATQGDDVAIDVDVANPGIYQETFEVEITYDGAYIGSKLVTLSPGNSTTLYFSWNTTGVAPNSYIITAEAVLTDDNPANNQKTTSIVIELPPGAIAGNITDASTGLPIEGAIATANGYSATVDTNGHYNITDLPVGTYNVTARATGYGSDSKLATVESEKTTSVNFALRVNSTITISVDPTTITIGENTTLSGSVSPPRVGVNVTIQYRLKGEKTWINLTTVTTNEQSQYSHVWTPETAGAYEIKARWPGDKSILPAESKVQSITVKELPSGNPWYLFIAAAGVTAIIIAAAAIYFLRTRKPKPT